MSSSRRYFVVVSFGAPEELHRTTPRQQMAVVRAVEKLVRAVLPRTHAPLAWNGHDDNGWPDSGRHEGCFLYEGDKKTLNALRKEVMGSWGLSSFDVAFAIQACKMVRARGARFVRNEKR